MALRTGKAQKHKVSAVPEAHARRIQQRERLMSIRYRPDIDGIRTISVSAVMIYHAQFFLGDHKLLSGGFLGVDVFFVISGFLITSLILREVESTGAFSFTQFYLRRARRILPVLLTVMLVSLPVGAWILLPSAFTRMTESLVASLFFVSNHFWNLALGTYGAQSGLKQPFLHTWSLAVEEQFYILFPLIFVTVLMRARRFLLPMMVFLVLGGLVFSQVMTAQDRWLSFYWLPSRMWELGSGALLACLLHRNPTLAEKIPLSRYGVALGMALVLGSMVFVSLRQFLHPGLITVPTILGACLMILCSNPASAATRLLSSAPFVWLGQRSYSAYLWHYPIFAFARIMDPAPGVGQKLLWIALTLVLSALSYRFVEQPLRRPDRVATPRFLRGLGLASVMVVAVFGASYLFQGFPQRFPSLAALYGPNQFDNEVLRAETWKPLDDLAAAKGLPGSVHDYPTEFEAEHLWFSDDPDTLKILLVGDSHSKDIFNAFHLEPAPLAGVEFARFGINSGRYPEEQFETLLTAPNFAAADAVVFTTRVRRHENVLRLEEAFARLKDTGKPLFLITTRIEYQGVGDLPLFDWYILQPPDERPADLGTLAYERRDRRGPEINEELREMALRQGVGLLDQSALQCDESRETCSLVTPDGLKMHYDSGHYTLDGARYIGALAVRSGWFDPLWAGHRQAQVAVD